MSFHLNKVCLLDGDDSADFWYSVWADFHELRSGPVRPLAAPVVTERQ